MSQKGDARYNCFAAAWSFLTGNQETVKTICFVAISLCFFVLTVHNIVLENKLLDIAKEQKLRNKAVNYTNQEYLEDILACARAEEHRCGYRKQATKNWTNGIDFSTEPPVVAADKGRTSVSNATATR